jgi:hypothetical protein
MTNPHGQQRAQIRKGCDSIRRALYFVRPSGVLNTLQEVVDIECTALAANDEQLPAIKESLERLILRLKESDSRHDGPLITTERWEQYFGEK